jgi:hypothetical protein
MIMGTNWILGYSHTTAAAGEHIWETNGSVAAVSRMACAYLENGIDAILIPYNPEDGRCEILFDGLKDAENRTGQKIIKIVTVAPNVSDTPEARKSADGLIKKMKGYGVDFTLIFHAMVEELLSKHTKRIDRLPDYLYMIREHGMIPGLSAHMPEVLIYADMNGYDVETYIQIYNCMGFLMQVEVENIHNVIWNAKKPVMTIKPMAAGRVTPFVGLTFSYSTIREQDMVAVGAFTPQQVFEDAEIALAAIERRPPGVPGRPSPVKTDVIR